MEYLITEMKALDVLKDFHIDRKYLSKVKSKIDHGVKLYRYSEVLKLARDLEKEKNWPDEEI